MHLTLQMTPRLQLAPRLKQQLRQDLKLVGGATQSIFPDVETLLLGSGDYQKALEYVSHRKNMGRYHSVIDFLFVELHPHWRKDCRRFYAGLGPLLRERLNKEYIAEYNKRMLVALDIALDLMNEDRAEQQNWKWFCRHVEDVIERAA